jgi:hypothetical protein
MFEIDRKTFVTTVLAGVTVAIVSWWIRRQLEDRDES